MKTPTTFTPPADSAINVRVSPNTTIMSARRSDGYLYFLAAGNGTVYGYETPDLIYVDLAAPSTPDGPWAAKWVSQRAGSDYAEGPSAESVLDAVLLLFPSPLGADVKAALLTRAEEYTRLGAITDERIAAAWNDALIQNVERCKTCGGYGAIECPACGGDGCNECDRTTEVYCADCGGYDGLPVDAANAALARVDARPENAAVLLERRIAAAGEQAKGITSLADLDRRAALLRCERAS